MVLLLRGWYKFMSEINSVLNRVHEWCEPERNPMTRMFLSRLGGVVCLVVEAVSLTFNAYRSVYKSVSNVCNVTRRSFLLICCCGCFKKEKKEKVDPNKEKVDSTDEVKARMSVRLNPDDRVRIRLLNVCKLIVGIISTAFFGILFSPMINFRIHLKLGLGVDNMAERRKRELAAKIEYELKKNEVEKERAQRFAQFQENRRAEREAKELESAIDAHLAELLVPNM